jgi:STE24 endopeptidase
VGWVGALLRRGRGHPVADARARLGRALLPRGAGGPGGAVSTASLPQWLGDRAKSAAIAAAFAAVLAAATHAALRRLPRLWWLAAGLAASALMALSVVLGPLVLDPLFFRFTPLPAGPLRQQVVALAERAGVPPGALQVYVMNASSRTTAPNAYVSGLGGTTRIVLYDTLLRDTPRREVLLVVAHELGHWRMRHVLLGLLLAGGGAVAGAAVLAALLRSAVRAGVVDAAADPRALVVLFLGVALLELWTLPVQNAVSRAFEARADAFALELTGDRAGFAAMQARLASRGLVDVNPPALIRWVLYDHPSPLERVAAGLGPRAEQAGTRVPPPRS